MITFFPFALGAAFVLLKEDDIAGLCMVHGTDCINQELHPDRMQVLFIRIKTAFAIVRD